MSRSNPHEHGAPNPATRWFEWQGETGTIRYYDKDAKKNVEVALPFTFMLLDQLASVRGWHEPSQSGIYSNEVRDTRTDPFVVKAFKEGTLVEGLYKAIRDRVAVVGGRFVQNCYIAYKPNGEDRLAIASLRFQGAALNAWVEFSKAHRADLYRKAISITGFAEGKKGRVVYRVPTMAIKDIKPETDAQAIALDKELQEWLSAYFARTTKERAERPAATTVYSSEYAPDQHAFEGDHEPPYDDQMPAPITDEDIPFAWLMPLWVPAMTSLMALGSFVA